MYALENFGSLCRQNLAVTKIFKLNFLARPNFMHSQINVKWVQRHWCGRICSENFSNNECLKKHKNCSSSILYVGYFVILYTSMNPHFISFHFTLFIEFWNLILTSSVSFFPFILVRIEIFTHAQQLLGLDLALC